MDTQSAPESLDVRRASELFKALGDPARLRLYLAITAAQPGEICVCELPDLGISQATVSHHLRKLREAGLVSSRRQGTWVHYHAEDAALVAARRLLDPGPSC